jgi:ribonuclease P protein component
LLFKEAFDGGPQWPGRTLVMWLRRADDASCRLGVVASKRTFHDAVQRNRARRLLREAFRLNRHRLAAGADVVLLARRRILDAKRQDVERDLLHVCRMAGLLQDGGAR